MGAPDALTRNLQDGVESYLDSLRREREAGGLYYDKEKGKFVQLPPSPPLVAAAAKTSEKEDEMKGKGKGKK